MGRPAFGLLLSIIAICLTSAHGQRLRDLMYDTVYSGSPCFRRLNGTHQIGCSSSRSGSVGALHWVSDFRDIDWLLQNATAAPYSPIIPVEFFTKAVINKLISRPELIAGVMVVNNRTDKPPHFSHDQRCPNELSQWKDGYCRNEDRDEDVWNPFGTGIMYRDIPFPMFYLPPDKKEDIKKLYDCYMKFNSFDLDEQHSRSLCSIEMNSFMTAAVNSEVCMRRTSIVKNLSGVRYCLPLSDKSIYVTLFPRGVFFEKESDYVNHNRSKHDNVEVKPNNEGKASIALVTAAMDTVSLFEKVGIGGVTSVSGLATLLATMELLRQMIPANSTAYKKNVLFVMLNGETFDYIGSQRMALDLADGKYPFKGDDSIPPISPMSIGPHVHIGQIIGKDDVLNAFSPDYSGDKKERIATFVDQMVDDRINVRPTIKHGNNIPPSSLHSFLRFINSSVTEMASTVLVSHDRNFANKYYQSIFDDVDNLKYKYQNLSTSIVLEDDGTVKYPDGDVPVDSVQARIANISTSLAQSLYYFVTDSKYTGNAKASPFIVDELIHCYLESMSCPLMIASQLTASSRPKQASTAPPPSLYVGVSDHLTPLTHITLQLSMFLSATNVNRNKTECKGVDNDAVYYEWLNGWNNTGVCLRSSINVTQAMSRAFSEPDYDFSSGLYSSWTESTLQSISIRFFLKPSRRMEMVTLGTGIFIFILSFIVIYIMRRHLSNILNTAVETESEPIPRLAADC